MPRRPSLTAAIDAFIDQKKDKGSVWKEEQLEIIRETYGLDYITDFEFTEKINRRIRKRMNESNN